MLELTEGLCACLIPPIHQLGKSLPESVSDDMLEDEGFLRNLHHVLLEVHVESGSLICPESGRYVSTSSQNEGL